MQIPPSALVAKLRRVLATLVIGALCTAPAAGATTLEAVRTTIGSNGTVIEVWLDGELSHTAPLHLDNPPRLVVDFYGAKSALKTHRLQIGTPEVGALRFGEHADKVRWVVDAGFDANQLRGAKLVRTDRGVALLIGDVLKQAARDLRGDLTFKVAAAPSRKSAAPQANATPPAPSPTPQQQIAPSREPESLAAAEPPPLPLPREVEVPPAPEVRAPEPSPAPVAAVSEPAPVPAPVAAPEPVQVAASERAPEPVQVAASERAPEPVQVAASERAPEPVQVAALPTADPTAGAPGTSGYTYADVLDWVKRNRGAQPQFGAGDYIRRADIEKIRPFVPPGFYEQFVFDDVVLEIQPTLDLAPHASFRDATLQYGPQTELAADGAIQNYVAGRPFSEDRIVSASPRDGGYMAAWNNVYRWQFTGYRSDSIPMAYIAAGEANPRGRLERDVLQGGGNVERTLVVQYQRVYLSHVASLDDYAIDVADADAQHFKDWMQFTEPFDMRGMAFVFERFRDPREPDQVNSYLPTERRVRRLSAKERSDSFVGSEMTMDDFEGFSGRILDYDWKYIGQKDVLYVTDSKHAHSKFFGPQSHIPNDQWQLRRCHVVESRPLYDKHPYGRKLTFFDAQTFNVAANVIFDRNDRLLKIFYTIYNWPGGKPNDDPAETVTEWRSSIGMNLQEMRSMVTWGFDIHVPEMKASKVRRLFSVSNLTGGR